MYLGADFVLGSSEGKEAYKAIMACWSLFVNL
jgi:hypothetical protein